MDPTRKRSARIKITLTDLKTVSHLSLSSTYCHLCSVDFCSLWRLHTIVSHTPECSILCVHHQSSVPDNPEMMSDLMLLFHPDLHPVILVLVSSFVFLFILFIFLSVFSFDFVHISEWRLWRLFLPFFLPVTHCCDDITSKLFLLKILIPAVLFFFFILLFWQSFKMPHMCTDDHFVKANDSLNLDGFVGPCHPHAVTQVQYEKILVNVNVVSFLFHLQIMKPRFIVAICICIIACMVLFFYVIYFNSWLFFCLFVSRSAIEYVLLSIKHHIWRKLSPSDTISGCLSRNTFLFLFFVIFLLVEC